MRVLLQLLLAMTLVCIRLAPAAPADAPDASPPEHARGEIIVTCSPYLGTFW